MLLSCVNAHLAISVIVQAYHLDIRYKYLCGMDATSAKLKDLRSLTREQLTGLITDLGEPKFRAAQIYKWLWQRGIRSIDEMSNLPKTLREHLNTTYSLFTLREDLRQDSEDGTIKVRFALHDGHLIEAVLIPVPKYDRFTVCVSTQVGCSLSCAFCATGKMDRARNLEAGEIYDQVIMVDAICQDVFDHRVTNIVYMGMGEPLLNYRNTLLSIHYLTDPDGLGLSPRRITVSTAGIAKMIKRLTEDQVKFNLALSLHAATDEKRARIMPINDQNDLESLREALLQFKNNLRGKITFEYIAFAGFNDGKDDAEALKAFADGLYPTINIIEYNPIAGFDMAYSQHDRLDEFAARLSEMGLRVTVRRSRGKDIDAACGQLANKE